MLKSRTKHNSNQLQCERFQCFSWYCSPHHWWRKLQTTHVQ